MQHKSLLTVLLLRRVAFEGAEPFAPCSFLSRKVTADACLPRETSRPDRSYAEQTPAWHSPRGVQGGLHFWTSPCAPGLAGTPRGAKTELKRCGLFLELPNTMLTLLQPNICTQQSSLGCSFQELTGGRATRETSPGCSACLCWGTPRPELGLGLVLQGPVPVRTSLQNRRPCRDIDFPLRLPPCHGLDLQTTLIPPPSL